ncbi:hypothetical protein KNV99_08910 [Acinetobacter nosocomialis]|nr:hypothetical protein KNV99_08910 [Acinetobacter nosocomialis]
MNALVENQPNLPMNAQTSSLILDPQAMQNMVAFADSCVRQLSLYQNIYRVILVTV